MCHSIHLSHVMYFHLAGIIGRKINHIDPLSCRIVKCVILEGTADIWIVVCPQTRCDEGSVSANSALHPLSIKHPRTTSIEKSDAV
jgi:hypothetical protein